MWAQFVEIGNIPPIIHHAIDPSVSETVFWCDGFSTSVRLRIHLWRRGIKRGFSEIINYIYYFIYNIRYLSVTIYNLKKSFYFVFYLSIEIWLIKIIIRY
jgi:hypothetical protein